MANATWCKWLRQLFRPSTSDGWTTSTTTRLGSRGEQLAAKYLHHQGYKIMGVGVRTPLGELDIVARHDRQLVFVEVKTRNSHDPFDPLEAVTVAKQRQLTRLALAYLSRHRLLDHSVRFDVVGICWPEHTEPQITHVKNAFESTGVGQMYS